MSLGPGVQPGAELLRLEIQLRVSGEPNADAKSAAPDDASCDDDASGDNQPRPDGHPGSRLPLADPGLHRRGLRLLGPGRRRCAQPMGRDVRLLPAVRLRRTLRRLGLLPGGARLQPDAALLRLGIQLQLPLGAFPSSSSPDDHSRAHSGADGVADDESDSHELPDGDELSDAFPLAAAAVKLFFPVLPVQGRRHQHELWVTDSHRVETETGAFRA